MKLFIQEELLLSESFWLSRILFIRVLGFIQFVAFSIALFQNNYLIGDAGLTPAALSLEVHKNNLNTKTTFETYLKLPTLFWFIPINNNNLTSMSSLGAILSLFIMLRGQSNIPIYFTIWILYLSIVNVGGTWYSFGWESQILENTFLAMLLVPVLSLNRFPRWTATSWVGRWGNAWLLFRIMIGAGLIKIRGDQCWIDLTCMNYHYLTQPVPGPLSSLFHASPAWFHHFETATNHVVELLLPWLLLIPWRPARVFGSSVQIMFQLVLIISGNLAFINWLTLAPAILLLDDRVLAGLGLFTTEEVLAAVKAEKEYRVMSESAGLLTVRSDDLTRPLGSVVRLLSAASDEELIDELKRRGRGVTVTTTVVPSAHTFPFRVVKYEKPKSESSSSSSSSASIYSGNGPLTLGKSLASKKGKNKPKVPLPDGLIPRLSWAKVCIQSRRVFGVIIGAALVWRSIPVVKNLLSSRQIMNTSYDPFRITNAYGLFGTITRERNEVVIQGTLSEDPLSPDATWLEYEFTCKPGNLNRRPCLITPYHIRADWLMWFAAFQTYNQCPWLVNLAMQLMRGGQSGRAALAPQPHGDPFLELQRRENQRRLDKIQICNAHLSVNTDNDALTNAAVTTNSSSCVASGSEVSLPLKLVTTLPKHIRMQLYKYEYSKTPFRLALLESFGWGKAPLPKKSKKRIKNGNKTGGGNSSIDDWEEGIFWRRKFVRPYLPPISLSDPSIDKFLKANNLIK